jgi:hypothetical protein
MTFKTFADAVHQRYQTLTSGELFVVDVSDIFATYLAAFPEGTNPLFRKRTEHDCNCCKQFIRRLGCVVAFDESGNRLTVWDDFNTLPEPYGTVARTLAGVVRQAPIVSVFRSKERAYGQAQNFDTETNKPWHHFHGRVADKHFSLKPDEARGIKNTIAHVLRRGLTELSSEAFDTVIDLIESNSIYRGAEHLPAIKAFRTLQRAHDGEDFIWANLDNPAARFRNTVIGTLIVDLSEGTPLDDAVRMFESKVAPQNYKRTTALITPKMIEQAVAKLGDLGLEGAVERRMAVIEDVNVNDVLFVDNAVRGQMQGGLTGLLMGAAKPKTVDLKNATSISIDDFFKLDLKTVDIVVRNSQLGNFVTLTAPVHPDTGKLFKWHNDFAWSYDGEVTDSIKARVKAAGGRIDAKLRVSLAWSNFDDLDLHVRHNETGEHIYFSSKLGARTGGQLDVDMNAGHGSTRNAVENVFWNGRLTDGTYIVSVHNFAKRESIDIGFSMETEFAGNIQQFSHAAGVRDRDEVHALTMVVAKGALVSVTPAKGVVGGTASVEKWGIHTETLVPVDTIMLSPNHWDGAGAVGNKHWFFILKNCKNPDTVRGIYNEFLRSDLDQHRKVFEVLGAKTKCQSSAAQLSGVGFSSTRSDEVTVVVNGGRAYNVRF